MTSPEPLVIIGAGGHGRETHDVVEAINAASESFRLLGFLADGAADLDLLARRGTTLLGPVATLADLDPEVLYVIAIGRGDARREIDAYASSLGRTAATLIHPSAVVGRHQNEFQPGVVIAAGAVVTTNVRLGRHCHLNVAASVSHDCLVGSYSTLGPGARLAGRVSVGDEVTLGIGAVVTPGRTIGAGSMIGAHAAVVTDIPAGATAMGVPARVR